MNDTMKRLGKLEFQASQQEDVINDAAANLKTQKDKFNGIIEEMRTIIRDERTGQEKIDFPEKEKGGVHVSDAIGTKHQRLTKEQLRLPEKKK